MRRLLLSISVIGVVLMAAGAGTMAYFSDTETATGNTFEAGTIDVKVDGYNPWSDAPKVPWEIEAKPCQYKTKTFTVTNVGNNPTEVYKLVDVTDQIGNLHPESEMDADPDDTTNNLADQIEFSLHLQIHDPEDGVTEIDIYEIGIDMVYVADIDEKYIYLCTLEPGSWVHVTQDFHMKPDAGNEYQGDQMIFDEEIHAIQVDAPNPSPIARGSPTPPS